MPDLHLCALVSAQQLEGLLVLNADDGLPIHLDHTVAGHQPGFLGGTAGDDRHHHQRVVHNVELDADAFERALQSLHRRLVVLGGGVGGVRIQSLQHRVDSQPVNRVHIDGIHVVLVDVSITSLIFLSWSLPRLLNRFGLMRKARENPARKATRIHKNTRHPLRLFSFILTLTVDLEGW